MEKQVLDLLVSAARRQPSKNFSAEDVQKSALEAFIAESGLEGVELTARNLRKYSEICFDLIEEVADVVVPAQMTDILGDVAEVKTFGRDDQVKFHVEGLGKGHVKMGIRPGARGGLYRAHRLDSTDFTFSTHVESVAYLISLEELLTGQRSLADIIAVITEGFVEKTYIETVKALRGCYSVLPAKNKATHSGDAIDLKGVDNVVRTISSYGKPVIIGFSSLTDQFANYVGEGSNKQYAASDLEEIKNNGRVGNYHGTKVITLPNYLTDATNTEWIFKETDLFILPVGAKPIKIAFQGEAYTAEVDQPHGGKEWHLHKMMGIGMLFNNNVGIYRQTAASGLDADGLY